MFLLKLYKLVAAETIFNKTFFIKLSTKFLDQICYFFSLGTKIHENFIQNDSLNNIPQNSNHSTESVLLSTIKHLR